VTTDTLFRGKRSSLDDFDFGAETAAVFDDMLDRSIPLYGEIQRMIGEIAAEFASPGSHIFDLGCSTGTTLLTIDRAVATDVRLVGIDSSPDMLQRAEEKFAREGMAHDYELVCRDLGQEAPVRNASVVIMGWTLQFIRPLRREQVIRDIARGLEKGGCLVLIEKVSSRDSRLHRLFIRNHLEFKRRRGYTDIEIAQKREALENVLIPYQDQENRELLLRNGFTACDTFFRWYNFCGILALK
jgi:tRNA (cmo5U34)-methyltransferase